MLVLRSRKSTRVRLNNGLGSGRSVLIHFVNSFSFRTPSLFKYSEKQNEARSIWLVRLQPQGVYKHSLRHKGLKVSPRRMSSWKRGLREKSPRRLLAAWVRGSEHDELNLPNMVRGGSTPR